MGSLITWQVITIYNHYVIRPSAYQNGRRCNYKITRSTTVMSERYKCSYLTLILFVFIAIIYFLVTSYRPKELSNWLIKSIVQLGNDEQEDYLPLVDWTLYTGNPTHQEMSPLIPEDLKEAAMLFSKNSQILSETSPTQLLRKLLQGLPLSCYSRKEGIFLKSYENLLTILSEYTQIHEKLSKESSRTTRTLVWQCHIDQVCGGLADRLKGMTFALFLAVFSRRKLVLDWKSSFESEFFKPNLINWEPDNALLQIIKNPNNTVKIHVQSTAVDPYLSMSEMDWDNYLHIIGGNQPHVVMLTNVMMIALTTKTSMANNHWLAEGVKSAGLLKLSVSNLNGIIGIAFRYLFQWDKRFLRELSKAEEILKLTNQPYIGVHTRTGFYGVKHVQDFQHKKLIKDEHVWKSVLQCAVSIANKFLGNESLLFLATDSNVVKEMAVGTYGMRFRSLNNYLAHVDREIMLPGRQEEGALYTLVDLFLLGQSYVLVKGDSGYPWLASLLCGLPKEHVIDGSNCKVYDDNVVQ